MFMQNMKRGMRMQQFQQSFEREKELEAKRKEVLRGESSDDVKEMDFYDENKFIDVSNAGGHFKYINEIYDSVSNANNDYIDFVKKHEKFSMDDEKLGSSLDWTSRMYNYYMINSCIAPLMRGNTDVATVCNCVGMYIGICMTNKEFHKNLVTHVANAAMPYMEHVAKRFGKEDQFAHYKERMYAKHGIRVPLDPKNAAIAKVSMMAKAFDDMRANPDDVDKINDKLSKALDFLEDAAMKDGISPARLNRETNLVIGYLSEVNPKYRRMFSEFSGSNEVYRLFEEVNVDGSRLDVWNGDLYTSDGKFLDGGLSIRKPHSMDEFKSFLDENFIDKIGEATTPNAINSIMKSFMAADSSFRNDYTNVYESIDGMDEKLSDSYISMLEEMDLDKGYWGGSKDDIRDVMGEYSLRAFELFAKDQVFERWLDTHGDDFLSGYENESKLGIKNLNLNKFESDLSVKPIRSGNKKDVESESQDIEPDYDTDLEL